MNSSAWRYANSTGYRLERITIMRKGKTVSPVQVKLLSDKPFKMAAMEEFEKLSDEKYPMILAECAFGADENAPAGNLPVALYKRHQNEQMKFGFSLFACDLDKLSAQLAGLYYQDNDVDKNEKYIYRLTFWQPDSLRCDTAYTYVGLDDYTKNYGPELDAYSTDGAVTIHFATSTCKNFNSFWIERSDNNGASFSRINQEPLAKNYTSQKSPDMYFVDSLVVEGKEYVYRIVGNDSFASESLPGQEVRITAVSQLSNYADFSLCKPIDNKAMELAWYVSQEDESKVSGFKIYRSNSPDGQKDVVYSTSNGNQRTWTDKSALYDNYYFISALTAYEEKLNPFPIYGMLIDSIPPDAPNKPFGYCDSLGRVYLSWNKGDSDVKGFRVFYANNPQHDFMQCSRGMLTDTFYVDTVSLNTLSKKVYYTLVAVDYRDNQSQMSEVLEVARYDTIAPTKVRNLEFDYQKHKVLLSWTKSPSSDVVNYIVLRKESTKKNFDTLAVIDGKLNTYVDQTTVDGLDYHYAIVAVDDFSNHSEPSLNAFATPKSKDESVVLKKQQNANLITLTWSTKNARPIKSVTIYRAENSGALRSYKCVSADSFSEKIAVGQSFTYCVRLTFDDDTESMLSNQVKIEN